MRVSHVALTAALLSLPADVVRAVESPIQPESRVWITGSSNIRHFTCRARRLTGALELRGETTRGSVLIGENTSTRPSLSVAVAGLDCGIGLMNRHLHEALKGDSNPAIEFRLQKYEVDLLSASSSARVNGLVTIGGVQRAVVVTAQARPDSLGRLHIVGRYVIRPTDFGIAPPRRFGGLLRVRDRVAVHFDVTVGHDCALATAPDFALPPQTLATEPNHVHPF